MHHHVVRVEASIVAAIGAARCTLSLMQPRGASREEIVVGERATGREPSAQGGSGHAGIVWLAPSGAECRDAARLDDAVARATGALAPHGVLYALAPRGWRRRLAARLERAGLETGRPVLHLGGARAHHRFLLPLGAAETRLLADRWAGAGARPVVRGVARAPGWRALAAELWPTVGIVARRPDDGAPWRWIGEVAGGPVGGWLTVNGWRGSDDSTLVHLLRGGDGALLAVAKVARAGAATDEAAVLEALGPDARAAGAVVPAVLGTAGACGGRSAVVLEPVPGARAWERLRARPAEAPALLDRVAGWLEQWNVATRVPAPLDGREVEAHLLAPLRELAPRLDHGDAYAAQLRALVGALGDAPVPRVATHGDLTMHNVLLAGPARGGAGEGGLAVVDWEAARADGWPLGDLGYAAVDVALATLGRGGDRVAAWRRCFEGDGAERRALRAHASRVASRIGMPAPFVELCHHACWLHHAANEQRGAARGGSPFLRIVRRIAERAARRADRPPGTRDE